MAAVTVKIHAQAHATLAVLATSSKRSMGEVLADLIEQERQRRWFDEADAAYARLQADPPAWADYQAELARMEGTLLDGLEHDPWIE